VPVPAVLEAPPPPVVPPFVLPVPLSPVTEPPLELPDVPGVPAVDDVGVPAVEVVELPAAVDPEPAAVLVAVGSSGAQLITASRETIGAVRATVLREIGFMKFLANCTGP